MTTISTPLPTPPATPQPTLSKPSSSSSTSDLSFLSLPPEIRLEIYAYLLHLPPITSHVPPRNNPPKIHAAILQTNRQIHEEAAAVLYDTNTFVAHPSLLAGFPRLRTWYPPVCCAAVLPEIRRFHLTLRLDCDVPFDRERAARSFSGAEELHVDAVQSVFLGVGYANLRVLEDVRDVKLVTIRGSTTGMEGYVAWLTRRMMSHKGDDEEDFVAPEGDFAARLNIKL